MVLCGNICFSGFYSDDFNAQGAERPEEVQDVLNESRVVSEITHLL